MRKKRKCETCQTSETERDVENDNYWIPYLHYVKIKRLQEGLEATRGLWPSVLFVYMQAEGRVKKSVKLTPLGGGSPSKPEHIYF